MNQIQLLGLEFFGYHGIYDFEKKEGNNFLIDITVSFDPKDKNIEDKIENTIDYEGLYKIAREVMSGSVNLIETLANDILLKISQKYPLTKYIEVSVAKQNPPIGGTCREARITVSKSLNG